MKRPFGPFVAYLLFFYLAWTFVWVHGVYPWATRVVGNSTLQYALVNFAFRFGIWVLPVFAYLRYVDHVEPFEYLQLKRHWKRGIAVGHLKPNSKNRLGV